jgi:hypothetical protein
MSGILASPPPLLRRRADPSITRPPFPGRFRFTTRQSTWSNTEIASAVATNSASGTGLQKASLVADAFEPILLALLKGKGVENPTRAQIERYVAGAFETLDAIEAMVTVEAAAWGIRTGTMTRTTRPPVFIGHLTENYALGFV